MTLIEYYSSVLVPVLAALMLGSIALLFARKHSASKKQFICSATLLTVLFLCILPFVPTAAKPQLPAAVGKALNWASKLPSNVVATEAIADTASNNFKTPNQTQLRLELISTIALAAVFVSLVLGLRLGLSLLAVARLRNRAMPAPTYIRHMTRYRVQVVESLSSPVAIGGFKPTILLPAEAENWPEDQVRAVLIHEEAHLDNGDPGWQILAELVGIIHWFNPLVWLVRRIMRQTAERAADDAVIRAGISPSAYAESLVAISRSLGRTRHSVAWTPFARKQGVKERVRAILNSRVERSPMKKPTKITAIIGLAMAAYMTSAYVGQASANPVSPYVDVRQGKTIAARASNGFVGRLDDGRKVEVLQISRQLKNGTIQIWKPDGTLIEKSDAIKHYYHPLKTLDEHVRYVVLRFPESQSKVEPTAGCGSGGSAPGEPTAMSFCGGGTLSHKDGYFTIVSYIGLPKEDAEKFPIGFGVADKAWNDLGVVRTDDPAFKNVSVKEVSSPRKGDLENESWWKEHKGPYTLVEFDIATEGIVGDLRVQPIFTDAQRKHKEDLEFGSFGTYVGDNLRSRYYFDYRLPDVKEYRVQTRSSQHCEIYDLATNPVQR